MTTPWAHLPNAVHIDRVLASFEGAPIKWTHSHDPDSRHAFTAAYCDAITNGKFEGDSAGYARREAWVMVHSIARPYINLYNYDSDLVTNSIWRVVVGLIAYDDSAHLLDSSPEEIKLLVALGHPYAIFFVGASKVLGDNTGVDYDKAYVD